VIVAAGLIDAGANLWFFDALAPFVDRERGGSGADVPTHRVLARDPGPRVMQPGAAAVAAMPVAAGGSVATLCAMSFNTELVPTIGRPSRRPASPRRCRANRDRRELHAHRLPDDNPHHNRGGLTCAN
jgi:hypothetical protein